MSGLTVRIFLLTLLCCLLGACGTVGAHGPIVTADQTDAPNTEHNLVVANFYFSPAGFSLKQLTAKNTETGRIHSFPFIDNVIMGSKRLPFERVTVGGDEVTRNVLFLDLPKGSYQVTVLGVGYETSNIETFTFDELEDLTFEIIDNAPTYLGDLYVVLSDDRSPRSIRERRAVAFSSAEGDESGVRMLTDQYPAIASLDFMIGNIVTQ